MRRLTIVVSLEPGFEVFGKANIGLVGMIDASKHVDVKHGHAISQSRPASFWELSSSHQTLRRTRRRARFAILILGVYNKLNIFLKVAPAPF